MHVQTTCICKYYNNLRLKVVKNAEKISNTSSFLSYIINILYRIIIQLTIVVQ